MANRQTNDPNAKDIQRLSGESPLKVSRRDVARRELCQAIRFHFLRGDEVVIHLLAAAARDVIAPIVRAAGKTTLGEELEKRVRPEYLKSWRVLMKEPYNFFKHGGSDPDTELVFFNPAMNDMILFEGCSDYRSAFGSYEPEMLIFLAWHFATYPSLLNDSANELRDITARGFEGLDAEGRLNLGHEMIDAFDRGLLD